ncbi:MAG TPA: phosphatase PAP2 family protein [Gemmatimonadales bacterium]|nr:phosphatase PAP2 family protein [Gemmatimonadales bacterium]
MTARVAILAGMLAGLSGASVGATAQAPASSDYLALQWWHPAVVSAGVLTLFLVDRPVQTVVQDHRAGVLGDVAGVGNDFTSPAIVAVAGGGALAAGLLARKPAWARTGIQVFGAYGLASGAMIATKWAAGRSRPSSTPNDNMDWHWLGGSDDSSLPSGSASVVFSLATTLADAIDHPAASVALYGAAGVNGWARIYSNRHWLSDVALGAVYGITAAKLMNGRWRIFGLRPPTASVGPEGVAVEYRLPWPLWP